MPTHPQLTVIVAEVGVEPTRPYGQGILSPSCLPFHHSAICPRKALTSTLGNSLQRLGVYPPRSFPPGHISGGHWSVTSENVFTMGTHSCLAAANLTSFTLRYVWGTVKTKISIKKQRFGSLPAPLWVPI